MPPVYRDVSLDAHIFEKILKYSGDASLEHFKHSIQPTQKPFIFELYRRCISVNVPEIHLQNVSEKIFNVISWMILQIKLDVPLNFLELYLMKFDLVYSNVLREFKIVIEKMWNDKGEQSDTTLMF